MKVVYQLLVLFLLFGTTTSLHAVVNPAKAPSTADQESVEAAEDLAASIKAFKEFKQEKKNLSRKDRKAKRKTVKKNLKESARAFRKANSDVSLGLLVLITILLPPVGMVLYEGGLTSRFWISLLLTLLFYIPGLVYTLIVILGEQ